MSNLAIGFANKYFTLWSVSTEEQYTTYPNGQHLLSGIKCNRTYIQNLSMDEQTAISKAKEMGCTSLSPDKELRGVTRSFSTLKRIKFPYEAYHFRFGQYDTMDIRECTDVKYLKWYSSQEGCEVAMNRVVELDNNYAIYKGILMERAELCRIHLKNAIELGEIQMEAVSNFKKHEGGFYQVRLKVANPTDGVQDAWNEMIETRWDGGYFLVDLTGFDLSEKNFRGNSYTTLDGQRSFKGTKLTLEHTGEKFQAWDIDILTIKIAE